MDNRKINGKDKWLVMVTALALYIVFAGVCALGFYSGITREDDLLLTWMTVIFITATVIFAAMLAAAVSIFQKSRRALFTTVARFMDVLSEEEREPLEKLAADEENALAENAVAWFLQKRSEADSLRFANSAAIAEMAMSRDIFFEIREKQQQIHFGSYWQERYGETSLETAKSVERLLHLETQIAFKSNLERAKQAPGSTFSIKGRMMLDSERAVSVVISAASTIAYDEVMIIGVISDIQGILELKSSVTAGRRTSAFLLESVDDIIYETDVESNTLIALNPDKSLELFGMSALMDFDNDRRPYWEMIHPDYREGFVDRFFNYDHLMILPGRRLCYEYRVKNVYGDYIWVEHTICVTEYDKSRALKVIGRIKDINEAKRKELRIAHSSRHDSLTGALVRSVVEKEVDKAISLHPQREQVLLVFNVNGFRYINQQYGMEMGDGALRAVVKELWAVQSGECRVAKITDDTFVLAMLEPLSEKNEPQILIEKLFSAFDEPINVGTTLLNITLSCGYACYPADGLSFNELYKNASTAMRISRWKSEPYTNNCLAYDHEMKEEHRE